MSKANPYPSSSNPNPNSAAMNSEDRVDVTTTARILRNQLLSFARGPESSFQSLSSSSTQVQSRLIALREIQNKHDEFEVEYSKEKAALDAKYQKIYHPLYEQRFKIVTGGVEVEGNDGTQKMGVQTDKDKGIPSFWLVAMKNNRKIAKAISEKDEAALAFLTDIEWSRVEPESFKIDFFFEKGNPFFSNAVLTKTYSMLGDEILLKTTGSVIDWYLGKSLLTENKTRKKVGKRAAVLSAKNKEPMTETEENSFSFFSFFSPLEVLRANHRDAEEVKQLLQQDYRIGITIRDKIIPHALYWYTGEAFEDEEIIDCPDSSNDDQFEDTRGEDDDDYYDVDKEDDDDDYDDKDDDDYEDDEDDDDEYEEEGDMDDHDNASKRRKKD